MNCQDLRPPLARLKREVASGGRKSLFPNCFKGKVTWVAHLQRGVKR